MADHIAYITNDEAIALMPEPMGEIDDADVLTKCIADASEEIDIELKNFGLKVDLPIAEGYRTHYFDLTVAYWAASHAYSKHSHQIEEGGYWMKEAQKRLRKFYNTTHWAEDAITQDVAVPRTTPYSNKGEVKQTDLTDPLDLSNES